MGGLSFGFAASVDDLKPSDRTSIFVGIDYATAKTRLPNLPIYEHLDNSTLFLLLWCRNER